MWVPRALHHAQSSKDPPFCVSNSICAALVTPDLHPDSTLLRTLLVICRSTGVCPALQLLQAGRSVGHLSWLVDIHARRDGGAHEATAALSHHDEGDHPCPAMLQDPLAKQCPAELHSICSGAINGPEGCNHFPSLPSVTPQGPGFQSTEHLPSLLASVDAAGT